MFFHSSKHEKKTTHGNMLLSQNVSLSMNGKTTRKNSNVLVVGSGRRQREAHYILPNLMQCNCSYVIMDDAAADITIQERTEKMFRENGYDIKVLDVVHPKNSLKYNPFHYIRDDADTVSMIDTLTQDYDGCFDNSLDQSLLQDLKKLHLAIAFYLHSECTASERTIANFLKILETASKEVNESGEMHTLSNTFSELRKRDPEHKAVKSYEEFLDATRDSQERLKKILVISCIGLTLFRLPSYGDLTSADQLGLASIGLKPTALYIKYSSIDTSRNTPLIPLLFTQLFETLYYTAEAQRKNVTLPTHVRIFISDIGACGTIQGFAQKMSTMHKYNISSNLLVRDLGDMKAAYTEEWDMITQLCDTNIYLADTNQPSEFFLKKIDGTRRNTQTGKIKRNGDIHWKKPKPLKFKDNPAKIKKGAKRATPLTTPEKLSNLKCGDCAIFIRGCVPIADKVFKAP